MHNRGSVSDEETDARARELNSSELSLLLPAVLILLAMSIYPQYVVERVEPNAGQAIVNSAKAKGLPAVAEAKDALKEDGQ
jgi:NADH:ubiquinone oxidoreductase subunit 4 (subunit M)